MSSASEASNQLVDWFKSNGLLIVTLGGIFLYIIFAVPATIFYNRLGTTPSEVGITYASLLSGSTFGVLFALATALALIVSLRAITIYIALMFWPVQGFSFLREARRIGGITPLTGSDQDFEERIRLAKAFYLSLAENQDERAVWDRLEATRRRMRELRHLGVWTIEQNSEYEDLKRFWNTALPTPGRFIARRARRIPGVTITICALIVIVALPVLAYVQAGHVLEGHPYPFDQLGVYHAEPATISPTSTNSSQDITKLTRKQLFFLGQNAQYVLLYVPKPKTTVRIPVAQVIVMSRS